MKTRFDCWWGGGKRTGENAGGRQKYWPAPATDGIKEVHCLGKEVSDGWIPLMLQSLMIANSKHSRAQRRTHSLQKMCLLAEMQDLNPTRASLPGKGTDLVILEKTMSVLTFDRSDDHSAVMVGIGPLVVVGLKSPTGDIFVDASLGMGNPHDVADFLLVAVRSRWARRQTNAVLRATIRNRKWHRFSIEASTILTLRQARGELGKMCLA